VLAIFFILAQNFNFNIDEYVWAAGSDKGKVWIELYETQSNGIKRNREGIRLRGPYVYLPWLEHSDPLLCNMLFVDGQKFKLTLSISSSVLGLNLVKKYDHFWLTFDHF